jgi:predicted phosphodiesterase
MRFWILSDLHIESCRWDVPDPHPDYDVLIAAGDIHSPATAAVDWLAARANGKPVVFVPGNHEWYAPLGHFDVESEAPRAMAEAERQAVHMLMGGAVVIAGVRILGAPLWTDYALYGEPERDMGIARRGMNDHRIIFPRPGSGPLDPREALGWHRRDRVWLETELAKPFNGTTVVVTHHLPHPNSIAPKYLGDPLNPAFCSDLTALVEGSGASLWVHGHTHESCDYHAGTTRVVCNPKGYGPRGTGAPIENAAFNPHLVVEV